MYIVWIDCSAENYLTFLSALTIHLSRYNNNNIYIYTYYDITAAVALTWVNYYNHYGSVVCIIHFEDLVKLLYQTSNYVL